MRTSGYDDSDSYSSEEQDFSEENEALSSLSFGSLAKAQEDLQESDNSETERSELSQKKSRKYEQKGQKSRKNKHAPSEMSSKRPVSVIRDTAAKNSSTLHRDIRFDPAYGKADLRQTRQNYAFLNEYREKELSDLKHQLKIARDAGEKVKLEKAIRSMSSRLKTLKDRDFEHKVLQKAKKENKFMTRRAKREFVIKERFKTMKTKDIDRVIERRRKKISSREKKTMPERRMES